MENNNKFGTYATFASYHDKNLYILALLYIVITTIKNNND